MKHHSQHNTHNYPLLVSWYSSSPSRPSIESIVRFAKILVEISPTAHWSTLSTNNQSLHQTADTMHRTLISYQYHRHSLHVALVLLILTLLPSFILASTRNSPATATATATSSSSFLLAVNGEKLEDCCCSMETIDMGNDESLYRSLQKLRTFTFFRIFKVNLYSECPFWRENPQCSRINCAVCGECKNEDVSKIYTEDITSMLN